MSRNSAEREQSWENMPLKLRSAVLEYVGCGSLFVREARSSWWRLDANGNVFVYLQLRRCSELKHRILAGLCFEALKRMELRMSLIPGGSEVSEC